jgi:hypothetical protein
MSDVCRDFDEVVLRVWRRSVVSSGYNTKLMFALTRTFKLMKINILIFLVSFYFCLLYEI